MNSFDLTWFELINREWTSPVLDHLMPIISSLDVWKPFLLVGAGSALVLGGARSRMILVSLLVGLLVGDVLLSHSLKHLFNRSRPRDVVEGAFVRSLAPGEPKLFHVFETPVVVESRPSRDRAFHGNSLPSSHVVNLFMLSTVVFRYRKRWGIICGCVGLAVSWSRIYCGAHWPSDIPPSILLGVLSGFTAAILVERVATRLGLCLLTGKPETTEEPVASNL